MTDDIPQPQWGLQPVRSRNGTIEIREVYYNSNGDVTRIEHSYSWPYCSDNAKNIEILSQTFAYVAEDKYNPNIIDYNHNCVKWDFMTDEQFEQFQEEQRLLQEAEMLAGKNEQMEDTQAQLNEKYIEGE